jgi:hypothetical protein
MVKSSGINDVIINRSNITINTTELITKSPSKTTEVKVATASSSSSS